MTHLSVRPYPSTSREHPIFATNLKRGCRGEELTGKWRVRMRKFYRSLISKCSVSGTANAMPRLPVAAIGDTMVMTLDGWILRGIYLR